MKHITFFHLYQCPYCRKAEQAFAELKQENAAYAGVVVDAYEETEHPDIVSKYDFYYAPTLYVGEKKIYEAHPGDDYETIKANVKKALDAALEA
ncbi:MAG: glutaredoxin [Succiniclasticum sp.]|jgi:glutaredoxin